MLGIRYINLQIENEVKSPLGLRNMKVTVTKVFSFVREQS